MLEALLNSWSHLDMYKSLLSALATCLAVGAATAQPMTFETICMGNAVEGCFMVAEGEITADTPAAFLKALELREGSNILLHSPGGNLGAGIELGRLIRKHGFFSEVGEGRQLRDRSGGPLPGRCESACAYAFLGGTRRSIDPDSKLGFHQFSVNPDRARQNAQIGSVMSGAQKIAGDTIAYLVEMDIDARLFKLASNSDGNDMFYPDLAVMESYSITTPRGYSNFFMEPFGQGVLAASRRKSSTGPYDAVYQVTALCSKGVPKLLFTADHSPQRTAPLALELDGTRFEINERDVNVRGDSDVGYITVTLTKALAAALADSRLIRTAFAFDRASGGSFPVVLKPSTMDQRMLTSAFRHCN